MKIVVKKKRVELPEMSFEQLVEENRVYIEYLRRKSGEEAVRKYLDGLRKEYEEAKKHKLHELTVVELSDD